ncbi:MAG: ABC transporter permease subunit [Chloroflexota bacterium]
MSRVALMALWEWFKLRRRWMPWILLVLLLLFSQIAIWGPFFAYQNMESSGADVSVGFGDGRPVTVNCRAWLAGDTSGIPPDAPEELVNDLRESCQQRLASQAEQLSILRDAFSLPGSILSVLGNTQALALALLAILTASVFGLEYGLGTVRTILVKGAGRWQYVAGKLALLLIVAGGALGVAVGATVVSSLIAGSLAAEPSLDPEMFGEGTSSTWGDAGLGFAKSWAALVPYVGLTALVTVLARSSAIGMAVGLGYLFAEQILVALLSNLFQWFSNVADFLLVQNINAFVGSGGLGGPAGDGPGVLQASLVLAAYTVLFGALAFWMFQRRDVGGASGGG